MAENLLHWLQEFQITVTTIEDLLPPTKPHLDRLFDQVLSFAKAYESERKRHCAQKYILMFVVSVYTWCLPIVYIIMILQSGRVQYSPTCTRTCLCMCVGSGQHTVTDMHAHRNGCTKTTM